MSTTPENIPKFEALRKRLDDAVAAEAWSTAVPVAKAIASACVADARAASSASDAGARPRDLNEAATVAKDWGKDVTEVRRG